MVIDQERRGACSFGSVCARRRGPDWNPSPSACGSAQRGAVRGGGGALSRQSNRSHVQLMKKAEKHQGPRLGTLASAQLRPRWEPISGTSETSLKETKYV